MRVMSIDSTGRGYDLSDLASDLSYSNVAPGGDETCTFTLRRSWNAANPEIQRGNIVRVMHAADVLWQGRVEETDRSGGDAEEIAVTAYGLGARLKDTTMQEIYVDRDLNHWGESSTQLQINNAAAGLVATTTGSVVPDTTTGAPAIHQQVKQSAVAVWPSVENWYDARGVAIGSLYYAWKKNANLPTGGTAWAWQPYLSTDDIATTTTTTGDLEAAGPGSGTLTGGSTYKFARVLLIDVAAAITANQDYSLFWTCLAVYGNHGLTKQGTASYTAAQGFYASDMIANAAQRATGITVRQVDATGFVVEQAEYREPIVIEDVIADLNRFDSYQRTWGTWGPSSPLDTSTTGYFDYTEIDDTPSWVVYRSEADGLDLHAETSTLYNQVDVAYSDTSGAGQVATRTASVPDLDAAGIVRKAQLDAGTSTLAAAQTLGDAFLALTGGFAPARGSLTVSQPITHTARGRLAPQYLRADGSALRIPDILPSATAFALDTTPDRRTTFPIRRVSVDCSTPTPTATVEIDQANDVLASLQARLGLAAQLSVG